jgi:penicillin-binding protein 1C
MSKKIKRPWYHWLLFSLGGLFLLCLLAYLYIAFLLPIPDSLDLRPRHVSTKILDRKGQLLYEVLSRGEGRKTYLKLEEMPDLFKKAVLAGEDSEFYNHSGVDLGAIARALFYNYLEQKVTSGASTITQQLVRNLLGTNRERNLQEKLLETVYAIRLSNAYSKDQILEEYLNTVYFGNLSYGVSEAARNYFGKNPADLDLAEISILAGLPKAPSAYNPLVNFEKSKKRQKYILDRMLEQGFISSEDEEEAFSRKLKFKSGKTAIEAPHFVHHVLAELEDRYGEDFVYGGLTVRTTLDLDLQKRAERIINFQLDKLKDKHVTNAALLSSTVPDGQILVWVGSRDYFDDSIDGQVDIINAPRQPGSALKPFLYLLALEKGWTLATIIEDLPVKIKTTGGVYAPLNYDLDFHGPVRLREALANSFNIPAVKTQEKVGTSAFLNFLRLLGLNTLDQQPEYYGLALTLGGGEIRLADLANAYFTLANYGRQKPFNDLLSIEGSDGKTIYKWTPAPGRNLLGPFGQQNAWLIINTLSDPDARLKSFGEGNVLELSVPAAAKTGTTRNFRDNWTFGFTPNLLTAVWVGNSDATPMENISGIDGAGPIWHDFMAYYIEQNQGRPAAGNQNFTRPSGLLEQPVCAVSGLAVSENCQESLTEWFVKGTEPKQQDYFWQKYNCNAGAGANTSVGTGTAAASTAAPRYFINYPFPYAGWAKERGYLPPPECQLLPGQVSPPAAGQGSLQIISPLDGDSFQINSNLPLTSQKIPLKIFVYPEPSADPQSLPSQITLSIDGQIIKTQEISAQTVVREISELWLAKTGQHTLKVEKVAAGKGEVLVKEVKFRVE